MFLSYDMIEAFAAKRNPVLSFPFLKENGELLSITVNSGFLIEPRGLELYTDFYENAYKFVECYPQYYRFTLGMAMDLEKGGMPGGESQKIAQYVRDQDLVLFDTSDCRKLETLTMLRATGALTVEYVEIYNAIIKNVDRAIKNPDWYTKFNKPLFYDLTHIIFFLTEDGTKPLPLQNDVYPCLMNMGILSLLDNDADLLAEICVCLDYIGAKIPSYWDEFLQLGLSQVDITYGNKIGSTLNSSVDEYHIYFVLNWYQALRGRPAFQSKFQSRTPTFSLPHYPQSILSRLSDFAHHYHFKNKTAAQTLDMFTIGLEEQETLHWNKVLDSSDSSRALIQKFSGIY